MIFALVGNQNCGKTTLFNALTGSNQHVGNFPGVTVDQKIGKIKGTDADVVDLPGIYSIRPYTQEEIVTRDFVLNQKIDGIINIVDATNIERNLYLSLQLLELHIPTVIALNMMDEVRGNGGSVDIQKLSDELGVPVVPISAAKNEGVSEVVDKILFVAKNAVLPAVLDFCPDGPVHRCIHAVSHCIEDHARRIGVSARFCATKLIEGDASFSEKLELNENERELIEHSIVEMESDSELERNEALAQMRYNFIEQVTASSVVKCEESKEHRRSVKIDFLSDVRLDRRNAFRFVGDGHRGADRARRSRAGRLRHQSRRAQSDHGRHLCGRGKRAQFFAHHRRSVFLPVRARRYRLYGARRVCHGQIIEKNRAFGAQFRANAHRIRLHRSRRHGDAHALIRSRS